MSGRNEFNDKRDCPCHENTKTTFNAETAEAAERNQEFSACFACSALTSCSSRVHGSGTVIFPSGLSALLVTLNADGTARAGNRLGSRRQDRRSGGRAAPPPALRPDSHRPDGWRGRGRRRTDRAGRRGAGAHLDRHADRGADRPAVPAAAADDGRAARVHVAGRRRRRHGRHPAARPRRHQESGLHRRHLDHLGGDRFRAGQHDSARHAHRPGDATGADGPLQPRGERARCRPAPSRRPRR